MALSNDHEFYILCGLKCGGSATVWTEVRGSEWSWVKVRCFKCGEKRVEVGLSAGKVRGNRLKCGTKPVGMV